MTEDQKNTKPNDLTFVIFGYSLIVWYVAGIVDHVAAIIIWRIS